MVDFPESRALGQGTRLLWQVIKPDLARRKVSAGERFNPDMVGTILDDALDILGNKSEGLADYLKVKLRQTVASISEEFRKTHVQDWVNDYEVRKSLKEAVVDALNERDGEEHIKNAESILLNKFNEEKLRAAGIVDIALQFLFHSISAYLEPADKLLIDSLNSRAEEIKEEVRSKSDRNLKAIQSTEIALGEIGVLIRGMDAKLNPNEEVISEELLVKHIESQVKSFQMKSYFSEAKAHEKIYEMADRLFDGNWSKARSGLREAALRAAVSAAAREGDIEKARIWISKLRSVLPSANIELEEARIKIIENKPGEAISILKGNEEKEAKGIVFNAIAKRDGPEIALRLLNEVGGAQAVSAHGALRLAMALVESDLLVLAEKHLSSITQQQIEECPVILAIRASVRVSLCIPPGIRKVEDLGLPFHPSLVPFIDVPEKIELRDRALLDLDRFMVCSAELQIPGFRGAVQELSYWLRLSHQDEGVQKQARRELEEAVKDVSSAVKFARLAIDYEIPIDGGVFESHLEMRRLLGGWTIEESIAALSFAISKYEPIRLLDFIRENRASLKEAVKEEMLYSIEIGLLADLGEIGKAKELIEDIGESFGEDFRDHLSDIVSVKIGNDVLGIARRRLEKTGDNSDRRMLVSELKRLGLWDEAGRNMEDMFNSAPTVNDATDVVNCFIKAGEYLRAEKFLCNGEVVKLLPKCEGLRVQKAWVYYYLGRIKQSAELLKGGILNDESVRQLRINISLETGNWEELSGLLDRDFERIEDLTTQNLLGCAQLATVIRHPKSEHFLDFVVQRAELERDAGLMVSAFGLAVNLGLDDKKQSIGSWLRKAIELSGNDGPIKNFHIREVVKLVEKERKHQEFVSKKINEGQVPLAIAAEPLRITLTDIIGGGFIRNGMAKDARFRVCLPLFSGAREKVDIQEVRSVAIDRTSLLTLGYLGLLDKVIENFEKVVIPRSSMIEFFQDLSHVRFHQPSRISAAQRLNDLVVAGKVEVISPSEDVQGDKDLPEETLRMIKFAQNEGGVVVISPPIFKPCSMMEEVADASSYQDVLVSPSDILDFLVDEGEISSDEADRVRLEHLSHSARWGSPGGINRDKKLVLDEPSLHLLDKAGVLKVALRVFQGIAVDFSSRDEAIELTSYSKRQEKVEELVHEIRKTIFKGVSSERVIISPRVEDNGPESDISISSLVSLFSSPGDVDAVLIDDRALNRNSLMEDKGGRKFLAITTADVIRGLVSSKKISEVEMHKAFRALRVSGVAFVPISAEEIADSALRGNPEKSISYELKAIFEYMDFINLKEIFSDKEERAWLADSLMQALLAIRLVWESAETIEKAIAAANRIFRSLPDPAEWLRPDSAPDFYAWACRLRALKFAILGNGLNLRAAERMKDYLAWMDSHLSESISAGERDQIEESAKFLRTVILSGRGDEDGT
ncbi:MAG: hypothetical protein K0S46_2698 [Moraxellaceae bacterium]|jgi:hypothetical protein|nr:hypothetical protein [Moraxellaceae bacterium]